MWKEIHGTKEEVTIFNDAINECNKILQKCNIDMVDDYEYKFYDKNALGETFYDKNEIYINYYHFQESIRKNDMHNLYDTILHEMLHAIAHKIEPNCGHRGTWKKIVAIVNNSTEFNISRLTDMDKFDFLRDNAKYVIECKNCRKKTYYQKCTDLVAEVGAGSPLISCKKCGGNVKLIKI